jgi:hypothetical protein
VSLGARETELRAATLLRRRSEVVEAQVAEDLAGADQSQLRRFVLAKLRADDLEESEVPALVLVARFAGLPKIRRDLEAIAADPRRPEVAREAARRALGGERLPPINGA